MHIRGIDERGPIDAERLGFARAAGSEEAGVVGQRKFDGGAAEGLTGEPLVAALDGDVHSAGRLLLGRRVAGRLHETDVDLVEPLATSDAREQRVRQPLGLAFLIKPGEHEAHPIAVAAVEVDAHLGRRWCRLADGAAEKSFHR